MLQHLYHGAPARLKGWTLCVPLVVLASPYPLDERATEFPLQLRAVHPPRPVHVMPVLETPRVSTVRAHVLPFTSCRMPGSPDPLSSCHNTSQTRKRYTSSPGWTQLFYSRGATPIPFVDKSCQKHTSPSDGRVPSIYTKPPPRGKGFMLKRGFAVY